MHIIDGIKNNLLSINEFAKEDYITIFDGKEVNIYDDQNTKVTVSRGAILPGWRLPKEGAWRILMISKVTNIESETITVNLPP